MTPLGRPVPRRALLGGLAVAGAAAGGGTAWLRPGDPAMPGTIAGADMARGHRLRDGAFPPPSIEERSGIVIAGGGIAGLSAGWALAEAGHADFRLLELEDEPGGNARGGRNAVSAYPLGAHYLPVPNREARGVRHLLRRLGVIVGEKDGAPVYDPYQLCADSQERLLWQGRYQEGLVPRTGLSVGDAAQVDAFFAAMRAFSQRVGADGRPAFAIPIAASSRDADLLALDAVPFAGWLDRQGWTAPTLRMHLRYACRDDYGCEPHDVSAWAGIHYFASRRGWAADGAGDNELTWPEGNARLARAMAARFADRIAPGRIVHRVARAGDGLAVDAFDVARDATVRTLCRAAILAMPRFVAARVAPGLVPPAEGFGYAPWVVANVTVDRLPGGRGAKLAWDNVSSTSASLGYVVATHQSLAAHPMATVLTWYMPLSTLPPAAARRLLVERPLAAWQAIVRDDLLAMNPDLAGAIRRIDVWRWGHAMIRPVPGFIWGAAAAARPRPPLFVAHSDLSGISIFEEAHYHGTRAAEDAMRHLGHPHESLL
ncbi:NAD(P)/FAD-dependent oxidoreductase [Sphingomonas profundi]|uniref:FAD-dependent oxidoreductase n=1 Tax=Alterirhizorhabdus profundi TaxID=2681549 RepID=UPI0012E8E592|nr:NAD(P)/FAD-dependent oxidoreductase [Sphingomonas profundi]